MAFAPLAAMPGWALGLLKEAARHVLRRPVIGIAAAARAPDGRWVLIRRGDTGEWGLPGGTLDWGETLRSALDRELLEEAGIEDVRLVRVLGVFSRPDRDVRFHAVTVAVECEVSAPARPPVNPLEIRDIRCFADDELPAIAMGFRDFIDLARTGAAAVLE